MEIQAKIQIKIVSFYFEFNYKIKGEELIFKSCFSDAGVMGKQIRCSSSFV